MGILADYLEHSPSYAVEFALLRLESNAIQNCIVCNRPGIHAVTHANVAGSTSPPDHTILNILQTPTYILTPNTTSPKFAHRLETVQASLQQSGFEDVEVVRGIYDPRRPVYGCAYGHGLVIEKALERKPFRPFLILEDDALHEKIMDPSISIPSDADALYVSVNTFGWDARLAQPVYGLRHSNQNGHVPNVLRVYNMLTTHAVLILTERFARNWLRCSIEACAVSEPIDVLLALTHEWYNVYAQKCPLFYQASELGGHELATRITFEDISSESINGSIPDFIPISNSFEFHAVAMARDLMAG